MSSGRGGRPAQLGSDDIIRFLDADHFLDELAGNLGRGRAFVRSKRAFELNARRRVSIEAPGVEGRVDLEGVVVFARDGYVGFELQDFEQHLEALDELGRQVESAQVGSPVGAAAVTFGEEDEAITGKLEVPAGLQTPDDLPRARVLEPEAPTPSESTSPGEAPSPGAPDDLTAALSAYLSDRPAARGDDGSADAPPDAPPIRRARSRDDTVLAPPPAAATEVGPPPVVTGAALEAAALPLEEGAVTDPAEQAASSSEARRNSVPSERPDDGPELDAARADPDAAPRRVEVELVSSEPGDVPSSDTQDLAPPEARDPSGARAAEDAKIPVAASPAPVGAPEEAGAPSSCGPAPASREEPPLAAEPSADAEPDAEPDTSAAALAGAPLPRMSPGGVLRVADPGVLLGLWLSGLREGWLNVLGGPQAATGAAVPVKIVSGRVVTLEGEVRARIGPWLTIELADPKPVRDLLIDAARDWQSALEDLSDAPPPSRAPLASPSDVPVPSSAPGSPESEPRSSPGSAVPLSQPGLAVSPASGMGVAPLDGPVGSPLDAPPPGGPGAPPPGGPGAPPPGGPGAPPHGGPGAPPPGGPGVPPHGGPGAPQRLPEPEDPHAPPEPPVLEGDRVLFRHAGDLRRELEVDLVNGGLFVVAPPLPIRTQKRLALVVGGIELPVKAEVDVVYADQGKVGFSVVGATELVAALRRVLSEGLGEESSEGSGEGSSEGSGEAAARAPSSTPAGPATGEADAKIEVSGRLVEAPSPPRLLELRSHLTGDLDGLDASSTVAIFHELVQDRFRGVLELESERGKRVAYLHEGNVAYLEAQPFDEETALGHLLTHHRRLTESALRDGLAKAKAAKKPLGRSLIALGLAKSSDVISALREQTRSRLESTFAWPQGSFQLRAWREPPGHADLVVTRGLGIIAHHLRARFGELGLGELESLLGARLRAGARPSPDLDRFASALGLPPKELRFLQVSLEDRSLEEAARLSPLGKLASLRLAALAFGLGLIESEARSKPPRSDPAHRGSSDDRAARKRRELKKRLDMLEGQNHFEVLGVHWSSHHRTFRATYEALLAEFSTVRGPYNDAPADVQTLARKCSQRVKEAFDVLSDDGRRTNYRKELFDATEREYSAQMLVEKGEVALMRGDRVNAIEHLETAVELAPTERNRSLLRNAREGRR